MKSVKNHLSLIIALCSILFSAQIFIVIDRSIQAYEKKLANNYSVVIVSQKKLFDSEIIRLDNNIKSVAEISSDSVVERFDTNLNGKNLELLKVMLPKFYKVHLVKFLSPKEMASLRKNLLKNESITKVEEFSQSHDLTYQLLVMFKSIITIFALVVSIVTMLLIAKELRIWQFKHNERMSIMGLFGAPVWLRSAILFRLSLVDAIISSVLIFLLFAYISTNDVVLNQFKNLEIEVDVFRYVDDMILLSCVSIVLSIILSSMVVFAHKEEV